MLKFFKPLNPKAGKDERSPDQAGAKLAKTKRLAADVSEKETPAKAARQEERKADSPAKPPGGKTREEDGAKGKRGGDVKRKGNSDSIATRSSPRKGGGGGSSPPAAARPSAEERGPLPETPALPAAAATSAPPRSPESSAKEGVSGMSEYELLRARNIARNNELLTSLEIAKHTLPAKSPPSEDKAEKGKRGAKRQRPEIPADARRSSSRLSNAVKQEELVSLPNTWDEGDERERRSKRVKDKEEAEDKEEEEEIDAANLVPPPSMAEFQEELLGLQEGSLASFAGRDDGTDWQAFARTRWGKHVGECKGAEKVDDWRVFVASRCPVLPDTKGSGMLQEDYCGDVYRLLVACILMSRVSSHDTKTRCINGFFQAFPTPSDVKDASDYDIIGIIKPLGLSDNRIKSLREVTTFFLEQKRFQIGLEKPIKPYGVGAFTYESYLIFCCGQGRKIGTNDKALSAYCSWLRKQPLPDQNAAFAVAAIAL